MRGTDNNTTGLVVSATDLTTNGVGEGLTATYTVRLTTGPVNRNNAHVPAEVDGDTSNGAQTTQTFTVTIEANPLTFGDARVAFERHPLNQAVEQQLPLPMVTETLVLTFVVTPALPAGLTYASPVRNPGTGRRADRGDADAAAAIHADGGGRR